MYATHMPTIRDAGLSDYGKFADIVTFTLLSIRQPFVRVPEHMDKTRALGAKSPHLWGWKVEGYEFLHNNAEAFAVWNEVKGARTAQDAIKALIPVPGLRIVKAAFVAQMLGFDCACFDSRNMKVLGLNDRKWRWEKSTYSQGLLDYLISEYVELSRSTGGAEHWWNTWCTNVAADNHETPERVSRLHLAAIKENVR